MDLLERPEGRDETIERLIGVYRVLKPHLVAAYERHLARANPIYEPPTRRILERVITEERRHAAAGAVVLRRLGAGTAGDAWARTLGDALTQAGGVAGDGSVAALVDLDTTGVVMDGDIVALESVFDRADVEPDLRARVEAHCRALIAGDVAALTADLTRTAGDGVLAEYEKLAPAAREAEIVACAKIGGDRMIKIRLAGPSDRIVLQQRWSRDGERWQLLASDIVATERAR